MDDVVGIVDAIGFGDPVHRPKFVEAILDAWRGRLVLHIVGLRPGVADLSFFDSLLAEIGTPYDLAEDATTGDRHHQRTGKRWMEVRFDPDIPDAYRHSSSAQPLHTDGSYIANFPSATLMFCVHAAPSGGETVFLPAEDLVSIMGEMAPELLAQLHSTVVAHRRSGDERNLPILRFTESGAPLLNWNYYCVDRNAEPGVIDLAYRLFAFLRDEPAIGRACRPVPLQPGEAVVWKDDRLLHGRNAFSAGESSERFIWKCAVDVGVWT